MSEAALDHLDKLVAFNTSNPPRAITADGVIDYAKKTLDDAGFTVTVDDLGEGCINLLAVRGEPEVLFNVHLDTVPPAETWNGDPFLLRVEGDCAIGLGACDIKGAAACMLAAAQASDGPAAILMTTDEEAGQSHCVRTFLSQPHPFEIKGVVVAEPTRSRAVVSHRGIGAYELHFTGRGGHGSDPAAAEGNALHFAAQWASRALSLNAGDDSESLRLNIGVIEGGKKANVAAPMAKVIFGMRPWSGGGLHQALRALESLIPDGANASLNTRFEAPPLAAAAASRTLIKQLGLPAGGPVDFWTEASLFAQAGLPAIVYGPGSIAQAHTADEWVALDQLYQATETYARLMSARVPAAATGGA